MDYFKGLAIVPNEKNSLLTSLDASQIKLQCHYHIGATEDLSFTLPMYSSGQNVSYAYTNIKYKAWENSSIKCCHISLTPFLFKKK